jgi:hypothetical protein
MFMNSDGDSRLIETSIEKAEETAIIKITGPGLKDDADATDRNTELTNILNRLGGKYEIIEASDGRQAVVISLMSKTVNPE